MIVIAREQKARWLVLLPGSTMRVKLLYPNFQRVSKEDIKAALRAISDKRVASSIAKRVASLQHVSAAGAVQVQQHPVDRDSLATGFDVDFSQAGVVAPPDGLTGETFAISSLTA